MKRFALMLVGLMSLAALNGCCHHMPWGAGYGGGCSPCGAGGCGYGGGYGGVYPGAVGAPGAYYTGTTMQAGLPAYTIGAPIYPTTTAALPLNALPTY